MLTIWSLSIPQVAATLAAALVGYQARLISEEVLNSVIVLMLVTAIAGPILTSKFASSLTVPEPDWETDSVSTWWETEALSSPEPFTVVVPIYNPETQRYLIEMASLIAKHESGKIVPLAIAKGYVQMDDPQLQITIAKGRKRLKGALEISQEFDVEISPSIRIDDDIALGISRISREQNASLVVMGWGYDDGLRARIFGNIIDGVFWSSHCPVAVTRLLNRVC